MQTRQVLGYHCSQVIIINGKNEWLQNLTSWFNYFYANWSVNKIIIKGVCMPYSCAPPFLPWGESCHGKRRLWLALELSCLHDFKGRIFLASLLFTISTCSFHSSGKNIYSRRTKSIRSNWITERFLQVICFVATFSKTIGNSMSETCASIGNIASWQILGLPYSAVGSIW